MSQENNSNCFAKTAPSHLLIMKIVWSQFHNETSHTTDDLKVFSISFICIKCQTKHQPWAPCCLPLAFPFLQRVNRRTWRSGTLRAGVTSVVVLTSCLASSCVYQVCEQHTCTHRTLINLMFQQQNRRNIQHTIPNVCSTVCSRAGVCAFSVYDSARMLLGRQGKVP